MPLTPDGGRVLGSLVEKQLTTPQQYPLTANALTLACNQTTNREPVVMLDDATVLWALDGLKEREPRLVRFVLPSHGRSVVRYRHVLDEVYGLDVPGLALLAILLLRGAQTPGELRARAGRMAEFASVEEVQEQLERLAVHPETLVRLLPRRPGQKEDRWQQLLAAPWPGVTDVDPGAGVELASPGEPDQLSAGRDRRFEGPEPGGRPPDQGLGSASVPPAASDEVLALRGELEELRAEVLDLQATVDELGTSLEALRHSLGG